MNSNVIDLLFIIVFSITIGIGIGHRIACYQFKKMIKEVVDKIDKVFDTYLKENKLGKK